MARLRDVFQLPCPSPPSLRVTACVGALLAEPPGGSRRRLVSDEDLPGNTLRTPEAADTPPALPTERLTAWSRAVTFHGARWAHAPRKHRASWPPGGALLRNHPVARTDSPWKQLRWATAWGPPAPAGSKGLSGTAAAISQLGWDSGVGTRRACSLGTVFRFPRGT